MPGIPTHFQILDLTLKEMAGIPDLSQVRDVMQSHSEWAHLGAMGPMLADFVPGTRATNPYLEVWAQILSLIGDGMAVDKGLLHVITDVRGFMDLLQPIVDSEDMDAIQNLPPGALDIVKNVGGDLKAIFDQIPFVELPIGSSIISGMRPFVDVPVGMTVPPAQFWKLRDYLCTKKPGAFAKNLLVRMRDSKDPKFLAYAYGWLLSYVANVVGNPFCSSIVQGTYRTHWWRTRWVNNYVDAWVWGNYTSAAPGADPPPYDSWSSLCDADLHKRIELQPHDPNDLMVRLYEGAAYPDVPALSGQFTDLWTQAFNETYQPPAPIGGLGQQSLADAYSMAWLVLWFQTASDGLGCNNKPPMAPDDDCGAQPPWVDLTVSGSGSGNPTVPVPDQPSIEQDPDTAEVISGILLAILGAGLILTGNIGAGGAALAGGIALIIDGEANIDWSKLRCYLYWYRLYVYHAFQALHEILTIVAVRYPHGPDLAHDQTMSKYFPSFVPPYDSGEKVTKSRRCDSKDCRHPCVWWAGGFDWMNPPTEFERDYTVAYHAAAFPSFFVDSPANPLVPGAEVRTGGAWPVRTGALPSGATAVIPFGNAVENLIDLLRHVDQPFPDWNLDADRGMAYHTWEFLNGVYSDPVSIAPES